MRTEALPKICSLITKKLGSLIKILNSITCKKKELIGIALSPQSLFGLLITSSVEVNL